EPAVFDQVELAEAREARNAQLCDLLQRRLVVERRGERAGHFRQEEERFARAHPPARQRPVSRSPLPARGCGGVGKNSHLVLSKLRVRGPAGTVGWTVPATSTRMQPCRTVSPGRRRDSAARWATPRSEE